MYWPLIGGFIAFVLLAVLIGWIIDSSARRAADRHEPHV
jgi:F0F1-type ATP synthase assembly protein I